MRDAEDAGPAWEVRDARADDYTAVLALNNAAVPNVNYLTRDVLERIAGLACYFRVMRDAEGVAGFVICLPSGVPYWSGNYEWFAARYASFLYLDRVVVAERMRGEGVGSRIYDEMHAFAATRWPCVALEVNLKPPNPGSVRFHERLGYSRIGVREYVGGTVAMYVR